MKLRCDHKVAYDNSAAAMSAFQKHNELAATRGYTKLTGYYCCHYCKMWHTTSLPAGLWASHHKFHEQNAEAGRIGKPRNGKRKRQK